MQFVLKWLFLLLALVLFNHSAGQRDSQIFGDNEKNAKNHINLAADETPLNNEDGPKRTARQLFLQPNLFVAQNFGFPQTFSCLTARGEQGACAPLGSCQGTEEQRYKRQLIYLTPIFTRQQSGSCVFYDHFGLGQYGVCCAINSPGLLPMPEPSRPAMNASDSEPVESVGNKLDEVADVDSETIVSPHNEAPTTMPTTMEPNGEVFRDEQNVPWPFDVVRYPWPSQFQSQYGGIQSYPWPPPIPTHRPSFGVWPPPIPTHPPNHHYPTHPPSHSFTTTMRPTTSATRRTTTTTKRTTTTSRPPTTTVSNDVQQTGNSPNGLPLQCGMKNPVSPDQERIVGGNNASPHEFPWIAVLFKSGKQFCGGSLITENHILSAAHCVARMTPWDVAALSANLGDYNIRTDFEVRHVSRRIKRLVRHKGFDFSTLHNDISILTLNEPVKFSYEIQPICLPTMNSQLTRSYSGYVATVVGWGSLRENGPQPSILQKVDIPVWTNSECARKYGGAAPAGIISSMLCAGVAARDSCSGDSGGPLTVKENGRYTQVGIVSWGIGCGKGEYPGVYTRVTSLLPWIYKNIK